MKSRKLLTVLLIAVLLVVYYLLGTGYLKQRQENAGLASRLDDTAWALAQAPRHPDDLETRLAAARADLDTVQGSLPVRPTSTQIVDAVLRYAEECHVKAIPLVTSDWAAAKAGDYSCSVFRLNVAVTGTFPNLVSFLDKLENGALETLIIESTSVNSAEPAGTDTTHGEAVQITAGLHLAIYTQPPASG